MLELFVEHLSDMLHEAFEELSEKLKELFNSEKFGYECKDVRDFSTEELLRNMYEYLRLSIENDKRNKRKLIFRYDAKRKKLNHYQKPYIPKYKQYYKQRR